MPVSQTDLEIALKNVLNVSHLEITDTSSGCGENYSIVIVSASFEGKTTLARHRLVNELLKDQIAQMHAFSQKTYTPKQWSDLQAKEAADATMT
ncbi:bola-like protein [Exidia glandulosa HHB12029]|uniref:Bola-like protein n=1 Tax=Exidia glandulosa HHB12029 TaxID=1314781 RepID=A0A165BME3_EXIGL|nr:bola-like protein [Exidia glandulosa HHB12029]